MSELQPCPFCGSSARYEDAGHVGWQHWRVVCSNCEVFTGRYGSKENAAEVWNTRPGPVTAEAGASTPTVITFGGYDVVLNPAVPEGEMWIADTKNALDKALAASRQAPQAGLSYELIEAVRMLRESADMLYQGHLVPSTQQVEPDSVRQEIEHIRRIAGCLASGQPGGANSGGS